MKTNLPMQYIVKVNQYDIVRYESMETEFFEILNNTIIHILEWDVFRNVTDNKLDYDKTLAPLKVLQNQLKTFLTMNLSYIGVNNRFIDSVTDLSERIQKVEFRSELTNYNEIEILPKCDNLKVYAMNHTILHGVSKYSYNLTHCDNSKNLDDRKHPVSYHINLNELYINYSLNNFTGDKFREKLEELINS
jgi:hypothetical protein